MFTIKIIGVLLVVVTCSFIGTLKSRALFERRKKLLLVLDGVNMLHAYIDQGEFELHIAINNAFSKCIFLRFCEDKILCEDEDLKNDKSLIEEFFSQLGSTTKKIECDHINHFILKLKTHLKQSEEDIEQKSKIYQIMGICGGLTAGMLLI